MAELEALTSRILSTQDNYTALIEYDLNGNPVYVGEAEPGSSTAELKWHIKRITYDVNGNPLAIQWADGSRAFRFAWDKRLDYVYN
jgi:hypothetical protein